MGEAVLMAPQVALVYGSFLEDNSIRDINTIFDLKPDGVEVLEPVEGNSFDFDSLKDLKGLVICCSTRLGHPPPGFHEFAKHLWEAANTNPGCLSHLSHCVYGNGDPEYERTYMNMPRYMDALLEKCGSCRVFPRGEFNEPNAALKVDSTDAPAWDALWADVPSPVNQTMVEWTLEQMVKKAKKAKPKAPPSIFAKL